MTADDSEFFFTSFSSVVLTNLVVDITPSAIVS